MTRPALSCSDVLAAFNKARSAAGDQAAMAVIGRLGARYAATVAPQDYEIAIQALTELAGRAQPDANVAPIRQAAA
jgi:hypothetical protein